MGKFWIDDTVIARAREVGAPALAVYAVLARWADRDGLVDRRHSSVRCLARTLGVDKDTITRLMTRLEFAGFVTIKRKDGLTNECQLSAEEGQTVPSNGTVPSLPQGHHRPPKRDGTVPTTGTPPSGSTGHPIPYNGEESGKTGEESPRARATRIPVDWDLTERDRRDGLELLGGTLIDVEGLAAAFRDYYLGNGTTREDWSAAWRSWCRREVGYQARQRNGNGNGNGTGAGMNGSLAERAAIIEEQLRGKGLCDDG